MITAVDTNVLIDVIAVDVPHGRDSQAALERAADDGGLVASPVVVAELVAAFHSSDRAKDFLDGMGVVVVTPTWEELGVAGGLWRSRRGQGRERILPDFLIVANATVAADRLLTRDSGMARLATTGLAVVTPQELLAS